jgi:halimadienyl-diphosphate synthase
MPSDLDTPAGPAGKLTGSNPIIKLLKQIGPGTMPSLTYDTAWIARLGDIDTELSYRALQWISENQLPDGSWGASEPFYYHDRVISTMAAMIALTHGKRLKDRKQIERGLRALEKITEGATAGLSHDPNGTTVGFEMIVPTLVTEAENLGLIHQQRERILGRLSRQREQKLALLGEKLVSRYISAAFSAEMAGQDGQDMLDIENLQEKNGSIGHSPSATAYYAIYVKPGDSAALNYLRNHVNPDGGAPDLIPFDVFETTWCLWNLLLADFGDENIHSIFQSHTSHLENSWITGKGMGLSVDYSVPDGDDTIFGFEVLSRVGCPPDIGAVLSFEEKEYFRCYHYEANSSTSVNIHALGALRQAGYSISDPIVQKVINYLRNTSVDGAYWFDKWHLSPYYTTAHAVISGIGYSNDFVKKSIEWIIQTRQPDGAWGWQQSPTAEETAYCIQALCIWKRHGGKVPRSIIQIAAEWLGERADPPYLPLWIGKGLFSAENIVRSAILSALKLAQES